jgi:hypothetical protein
VLHIQNRDRADHDFHLRLDAPAGFELLAGQNPMRVAALDSLEARVFVVAAEAGGGVRQSPIRFVLERAGEPARSVARSTTFLYAPGARDGG